MFLSSFSVSTVGEHEPTEATIWKIGRHSTTLSCFVMATISSRNVLRLCVTSWGLHWKSLVEVRLL